VNVASSPEPGDPFFDLDDIARARAIVGLSVPLVLVFAVLNTVAAPITHNARPLGVAGACMAMALSWTLALRAMRAGRMERAVLNYVVSGLVLLLVMGLFVPELGLLYAFATFVFIATALAYLPGRASQMVVGLGLLSAFLLLLTSLGLQWRSGVDQEVFRWVNFTGVLMVLSVDAVVFIGLRGTLEARAARLLKAEHEAVVIQQRLEKQARLEGLGQLAGGVAHDFNNMLTVILNYSAMVADDLADRPRALEDITRVREAAERAASLTRKLLIFGRRDVPRVEVVDVNDIVRGAEPLLRSAVGEAIELRTRLAVAPSPVSVDVGQIEQVLLNLTVNARDAMPEGGTLLIETGKRSFEGDPDGLLSGRYVRIAVTDTGSGFSPEARERGFEPFFTTKPIGQGTGLGLSTVYGIARGAGGDVRITSEAVGSTVTVYLPQVTARAAPEPPSPSGPPDSDGQRRLLVVEDEEAVRSVTRSILERNGYDVVTFGAAEEALAELASDARVDLLLTDVVMPGMSGPQLADRARGLRPDLPVLLMSGYPRDLLEQGAIDPGLVMVKKPFDSHALLDHVTRALR
jgi:signal transduction histidine kinase